MNKQARRITTELRAHKYPEPKLVVVLGGPGTGKTRFALATASALTLSSRPLPVLLFAPGADKLALLRRLIQTWKPSRLPTLRARLARLRAAPLFIETKPRLWPVEMWLIASRIDRALKRRRQRLGLIVVDELAHIGGRSFAHRVMDLTLIAHRQLSGLPVIALGKPHPSLIRALKHLRVASTSLEETP